MPANITLGILDSNQRAAQTLYQNIDNQVNGVLEMQLKGSELQYKLAKDATDAAEQKRMNDARIIGMQSENNLRAFQLETERQLAPLKLQDARTRLAAQRVQQSSQLFSGVVAPYDNIVGSVFAKTQNPDMIRKYAEYKQGWAAAIASGHPFDQEQQQAYQKNVSALIKNYDTPEMVGDSKYNPETSNYLAQVNPIFQKQYEDAKNPVNQPIISSLKQSLVFGDPQTRASIVSKYGDKFDEIDLNRHLLAGETIDGIRSQEKAALDYRRTLVANEPSAKDSDETRAQYQNALNKVDKEINELRDHHQQIKESLFGKSEFDQQASDKVDKAAEEAARKKKEADDWINSKVEGINFEEKGTVDSILNPSGGNIQKNKDLMIDSKKSELTKAFPRIGVSFGDLSWVKDEVKRKGSLDENAKANIVKSMENAVDKVSDKNILIGDTKISLAGLQHIIDNIPYDGNDMKFTATIGAPMISYAGPNYQGNGDSILTIPLYSTDDKEVKKLDSNGDPVGNEYKTVENRNFYKQAQSYLSSAKNEEDKAKRFKKLVANVLAAQFTKGLY